jgi:dihydrofolate reductase
LRPHLEKRTGLDESHSGRRRAVAAAAIELGLVDELRMFRNPVVVGGGTPFLPPVIEDVPLDLSRPERSAHG